MGNVIDPFKAIKRLPQNIKFSVSNKFLSNLNWSKKAKG